MEASGLLNKHRGERAALVGVERPDQPAWLVHDGLDELELLAATDGLTAALRFTPRVTRLNPATYIGKGKTEELGRQARENGARVILFDEELSPAQNRNIEKLIGLPVLDRTQVILDIFAQRAVSHEGRLQIELARLEYALPRLRHRLTQLGQQRGAIGVMGGAGEQQLELDRRRVTERIARLRGELAQVGARRHELRRGRRRHGWGLVCLVGYTNAGKSTLLNALTGARIYADDLLFATLDPTTRRLNLPRRQPALLTDTVGFIRKLPHRLVQAFKATLEEVREADALLHVVDAAHPRADAQIEAVLAVLGELGALDKPIVTALNKTDLPEGAARVRALADRFAHPVAISARTGAGFDDLRAALGRALGAQTTARRYRIPAGDGALLARLREGAEMLDERYESDWAIIRARVPERLRPALEPYRWEDGE